MVVVMADAFARSSHRAEVIVTALGLMAYSNAAEKSE